jgi:hypothetical protein
MQYAFLWNMLAFETAGARLRKCFAEAHLRNFSFWLIWHRFASSPSVYSQPVPMRKDSLGCSLEESKEEPVSKQVACQSPATFPRHASLFATYV